MRFFVTGASGFIGSRLVAELIRKYGFSGNDFICLCHNEASPFIAKEMDEVRVVYGDISNRASIEPYFEGVDVVFHAAGRVGYGDIDAQKIYDSNVNGTENILWLSNKYKVKRVVNIGTSAIWAPTNNTLVNEETPLKDKHNTHYTRSKYLSWLKTLEYIEQGLPIVTVMPAGVFGKGSPLFAPLLKLLNAIPVAIITKSTTKMSLIHVDDLIAGIIKAYEYGTSGRIYILSGEAVTLQQILRCCGARIVLDIPEPILRVIIRTCDYLSQIFRCRFYINTEFLNFTIGGLLVDGSRAKEELDFYVNDTRNKLSNMVKWHKEAL